MRILGIIPARYASQRFPGKPLIDIDGKTMIRRVYEQAKKAGSLSEVIVATDDERISKHVQEFGGKALMTSSSHRTGTDRCAEVAGKQLDKYDVIINIQGDEPFINPDQINVLAACFNTNKIAIATLAKRISETEDLFNPNVPKVILDHKGEALYFSRHPIPYLRGAEEKHWVEQHTYFRHIGIYAFRTSTLMELTTLQPHPLEVAESLEQLRWLGNGYSIQVALTDHESFSVDVPEDLDKLNKKTS